MITEQTNPVNDNEDTVMLENQDKRNKGRPNIDIARASRFSFKPVEIKRDEYQRTSYDVLAHFDVAEDSNHPKVIVVCRSNYRKTAKMVQGALNMTLGMHRVLGNFEGISKNLNTFIDNSEDALN